MYTGGSIKELRSAISFQPSKEGMGVQQSLQRMIELFLNKSESTPSTFISTFTLPNHGDEPDRGSVNQCN